MTDENGKEITKVGRRRKMENGGRNPCIAKQHGPVEGRKGGVAARKGQTSKSGRKRDQKTQGRAPTTERLRWLVTCTINQRLKYKTEDFERNYREHKDLEKEYDRQRERSKEAWSEAREKTEALLAQVKILQETKEKMSEEAALEKARMLDEWNQLLERSKVVLYKVKTT